MSDYLTLAEVLAIHSDQIQRYGGSAGVRDYGTLEAAHVRFLTRKSFCGSIRWGVNGRAIRSAGFATAKMQGHE